MFPFTKLPLELRLHIYPHMDLQLSPLERAQPAILDAVANTPLYAEILPFCHAQNKAITNDEQATFKKVPLKEILKIRSLKLVFPADREAAARNNLNLELRANKILLMNRISTLIFDFSLSASNYDALSSWDRDLMLADYLMRANPAGLRKIVVIVLPPKKARGNKDMIGKENAVEEKYKRKSVSQATRDRAIRRTDERLGTSGKLRIVKIVRQGGEKLPSRRARKVHVWMWEGRWTEPYQKKKKDSEETRAREAESGEGSTGSSRTRTGSMPRRPWVQRSQQAVPVTARDVREFMDLSDASDSDEECDTWVIPALPVAEESAGPPAGVSG